MGKSYKKTPISKDNGKSKKQNKKIASKITRQKLKKSDVSSGNEYKKHYESYNIADYVCRWTKEEAIEQYNNSKNNYYTNWKEVYSTLEDFLNYWEKCMRRK